MMEPKEREMGAHLRAHFARCIVEQPTWFYEIRTIKPDGAAKPSFYQMNAESIDVAVTKAATANRNGANVYFGALPRKTRDSNASAVAGADFCFVDADDAPTFERLRSLTGDEAPSYFVETGGGRGHAYWEIDKTASDLNDWRTAQHSLIDTYNTDRAIHDAPRIMRLAGSINWPNAKKKSDGREPELCGEMILGDGQPRSLKSFQTVMTKQPSEKLSTTPTNRFEQWTNAIAQNNGGWHEATIALVASLVTSGMSPDAIRAMAHLIRRDGFTIEETRHEIETALQGAIAKYGGVSEPAEPQTFDYPEWDQTFQPKPFVVKDLIGQGELWAVIGPPKTTKSFITIDLAMRVSLGMDWFAQPTDQGGVLMVCGERGVVQRKRGAAWGKAHSITAVPPIRTLESSFSLWKEASHVNSIIDAAQKTADDFGSCNLVIIDTFASTNAGADDVRDMPSMLAPLLKLRDALPDTAIVVVHHSSASTPTKARGRTDFLGAVDGQLNVQRDGTMSRISLGSANDVSIPFSHRYGISDIEVAKDANGEAIEVGYVDSHSLRSTFEGQRTSAKGCQRIMEFILQAATMDQGSITRDEWMARGEHYSASTAKTADNRRRAMDRAIKNLLGQGAWALESDDDRFEAAATPCKGEPPRVYRRPFGLSHATIASSSFRA